MKRKSNYSVAIIMLVLLFFINIETIKAAELKEPAGLEIIEMIEKTEEERENVPFDDSLRQHVNEVAASYSLKPALVMAVIEKESSFQSGVHNGTHKGLMQITAKWHQERMERLQCFDLYDPYQNIVVGTDLLSELMVQYDNCMELSLMAYNMGTKLAEENYEQGIITTYASTIINKIEDYQ